MTQTLEEKQIATAPPLSAAGPKRIEQAKAYAVEAARLCADRRCANVRVLDVTGLSPVCDFFVLATAAGGRQMGTVAREAEELAADYDLRPMHSVRRAEPNDRWVAIDLVDAIVHVFSDEARLFYDLDNLWGDAREVRWSWRRPRAGGRVRGAAAGQRRGPASATRRLLRR